MRNVRTVQAPLGGGQAGGRTGQIRKRAGLGVLLAGAVLALPGCAAGIFGWRQLPPPGPRPSAVVLDFHQAPRVVERRDTCRNLVFGTREVETEKDRRGWWLGSQDIQYNANWGIIMADIVADRLREECVYNVLSRRDVKVYYADKQELLAEKLGLEGKELDRAVLALNPVNIGREMGVEKVVVGQIVDAELRTSRAFGTFSNAAAVNVSVYDTATGKLEFSYNMSDVRPFSTGYGHLEQLADEFIQSLKRFYNARMVPAYTLRR